MIKIKRIIIKQLFICIYIIISYSFSAQTATDGLYFDGVDDNITVPGTTNINSTTTNNRTYETSFKVINANSSTKQIIMKEGGWVRAVIIYVQNGYLHLGAYNRADYTPNWTGTFYRKPISSNTWYHIALVFDDAKAGNANTNPMNPSANNALKWYLNGSLMGEISGYQLGGHNTIRLGYKNEALRFPSCNSWTTTGASEYCFGTTTNDSGGNEYYFNGYLWGFRVWNDVRTPVEINANMTNIITTVGVEDLVAALDGDTFSYLDSNDNVQEATTSANTMVSWSATATTTDWNTGSNWVGGIVPNPNTKQDVRIVASTNYPEIDTHIITGDLIVESTAVVTINQGGALEVAYDITNNGIITINDSGSFLLKKQTTDLGTGTFNVKRTVPTYAAINFYSYWSSPLVEVDSNPNTLFSNSNSIYYFDASHTDADWAFNGGANLKSGVGYAVLSETTGGEVRTFTGKINTGDISVPVHFNTNVVSQDTNNVWSTGGDNLLGNPYASAIDWDLVITDPDNSSINGTIFFWDQTSANVGNNNVSDYKQYNLTGGTSSTATGKIGTAQGFFIKTTSNTTITFKPTHQIATDNNQFFKSDIIDDKKQGRSWFKLSDGEKENILLIGFLEGASDKFDRLYDAYFDISQEHLGFYSLIEENTKVSIQGLPKLIENEKRIPLGFTAQHEGNYSLSMQEEYIDNAYNIYLKDKEIDSIINLKENITYDFSVNFIGENDSRFELIYSSDNKTLGEVSALNTPVTSKKLLVYVNAEKELIVSYNSQKENIKKVSLYTIEGKKIATFLEGETKNIASITTGAYLVKVTLQNNLKLTKLILF